MNPRRYFISALCGPSRCMPPEVWGVSIVLLRYLYLIPATQSGPLSNVASRFDCEASFYDDSEISYDTSFTGGVVTTCPSFTKSVGPGLKSILTVPSLPSSR